MTSVVTFIVAVLDLGVAVFAELAEAAVQCWQRARVWRYVLVRQRDAGGLEVQKSRFQKPRRGATRVEAAPVYGNFPAPGTFSPARTWHRMTRGSEGMVSDDAR
jgi:hypothetical protein